MAKYEGVITLTGGLVQANGNTFPLMEASAIQIDDEGTRLDEALEELSGALEGCATSSDLSELAQTVEGKADKTDVDAKLDKKADETHTHSTGDITDLSAASVKYAETAGSAGSVAWEDVTNKPTSFTPSSHKHAIDDVTNLGKELEGIESAAVSAAKSEASAVVASHEASTTSHNDIRTTIEGLTTSLTNLSTDVGLFLDLTKEEKEQDAFKALDQLSELIQSIQNNKTTIDAILIDKADASAVQSLEGEIAKKADAKHGHDIFTHSTSDGEGKPGFVPSPTVTETDKYLRGDGAWTTPTIKGNNKSSTVKVSVPVVTVQPSTIYLDSTISAPSVTTGTVDVLSADTELIVSGGTPTTKNIDAVITSVEIGASSTQQVISGFGTHTKATVPTALTTTTVSNPTVSNIAIPNVTNNESVTIANIAENKDVPATRITSWGSVSSGSSASWVPSVEDGVLKFSWTTNVPTSVVLPSGDQVEASKVSTTNVTASKVTLGESLSASQVKLENVTVATGEFKSEAGVITDLGTPSLATVVTGVDVTQQPTVRLTEVANGGVSVVEGVSAVSVDLSENSSVAAIKTVSVGTPEFELISSSNKDSDTAIAVVSSVSTTEATEEVIGTAEAQVWAQTTEGTSNQ